MKKKNFTDLIREELEALGIDERIIKSQIRYETKREEHYLKTFATKKDIINLGDRIEALLNIAMSKPEEK